MGTKATIEVMIEYEDLVRSEWVESRVPYIISIGPLFFISAEVGIEGSTS